MAPWTVFSTLVRWITVVIVGLSPILTFWMARALNRFLRRKLRQRREVAFRNEHEHSRDEAE
jgi:hypothetical protein